MKKEKNIDQIEYDFLDNARDVFLFVDPKTARIVGANKAAVDAYGYTKKELLSMSITDIRTPETKKQIPNQLKKASEKGILFETIHVKKDGSNIPVEVSAKATQINGKKVLLSIIRNIEERKQTEQHLKENEERFRRVFEDGPLGVILLGPDNRFLRVNHMFCKMLGYSEKELVGKSFVDITYPEDINISLNKAKDVFNRNKPSIKFEKRYIKKNGEIIWVSLTSSTIRNEQGKIMYALAMFEDITKQKKTQDEILQTTSELKAIFQALPDLYFRLDFDGNILDHYAGNKEDLFLKPNQFIGKKISDFMPKEAKKLFDDAIAKVKKNKTLVSVEYWLDINNQKLSFEARFLPLLDNKIIVVIRNITERKHVDEIIRHQAYYDHLTDLPNRSLFYDRLANQLTYAKRYKETLAVLFLDLDYFKVINDTLGHVVADKLLTLVAKRLKGLLRESETCARLGGDEFLILLPKMAHPSSAESVAKRILRSFGQPWIIDGNKVRISASVGIAIHPIDGTDAEMLIHSADTAMYLAKEEGRCCHKFFKDIDEDQKAALRIRERRILLK